MRFTYFSVSLLVFILPDNTSYAMRTVGNNQSSASKSEDQIDEDQLLDSQYSNYLNKEQKKVSTQEEFNYRKQMYKKKDDLITEHNNNPDRTGTLKHNFMSDMTDEEIEGYMGLMNRDVYQGLLNAESDQQTEGSDDLLGKGKHGGKKGPKNGREIDTRQYNDVSVQSSKVEANLITIDGSDWTNTILSSEVLDQGQCGSCWAFSCVQAIESYVAKNHDLELKFSEQNLVDCCSRFGCNGGLMAEALLQDLKFYTHELYGAYKATDQKCRITGDYGSDSYRIKIHEMRYIGNSQEEWISALDEYGTIIMACCGSDEGFYMADQGIAEQKDPNCQINHAISAVGYYFIEDGEAILICKNSWGIEWGNQGYIHMRIGDFKSFNTDAAQIKSATLEQLG